MGDVKPGGRQSCPGQSFDAVLHDPPRFGNCGWSCTHRVFYDQLARVLKPRGAFVSLHRYQPQQT